MRVRGYAYVLRQDSVRLAGTCYLMLGRHGAWRTAALIDQCELKKSGVSHTSLYNSACLCVVVSAS